MDLLVTCSNRWQIFAWVLRKNEKALEKSMAGYWANCTLCFQNYHRNNTVHLPHSFTFLYASDGFPSVLTKTIPTSTMFFNKLVSTFFPQVDYIVMALFGRIPWVRWWFWRWGCYFTVLMSDRQSTSLWCERVVLCFWEAVHNHHQWRGHQWMKCRPVPMTLTKPYSCQLRHLLQSLPCYCMETDNRDWKLGK